MSRRRFLFVARSITLAEWDRVRQSVFFGRTLDINPTYNWAHYTSFGFLMVAVGITIAGMLLKGRETNAHDRLGGDCKREIAKFLEK